MPKERPAMNKPITRLYPLPSGEYALQGLYLAQALHELGSTGKPFVYSNFITSLDGRIAIASEDRATHQVPAAITNPRDWRLYQELAGQADLLITSGRFFRQTEIDEAQDVLPISTQADYADIREWRSRYGLPPQPDIAILSRSLAIPLESLEAYRERRIMVITGSAADPGRVGQLRAAGIEVLFAGSGHGADGGEMVAKLADEGYRSLYAIAGPDVLHTLLEARVLDRLYLTTTHQLLAGDVFDTLTRGNLLEPAFGMQLSSLYLDTHAPNGASQWFTMFEARRT
jgi:riboflavin biosynthesis pyrimidine reductase